MRGDESPFVERWGPIRGLGLWGSYCQVQTGRTLGEGMRSAYDMHLFCCSGREQQKRQNETTRRRFLVTREAVSTQKNHDHPLRKPLLCNHPRCQWRSGYQSSLPSGGFQRARSKALVLSRDYVFASSHPMLRVCMGLKVAMKSINFA